MKKYKQLTSEQRYAIYLGLENGDTQRTIASLIGVSPSAVSRELQRNKDKRGGYSWRLAHEMAMERRERLPGNRSTPEWIKQKVNRLVRKDWSPGQISGHLRKKENIRVSHETIYKWIRPLPGTDCRQANWPVLPNILPATAHLWPESTWPPPPSESGRCETPTCHGSGWRSGMQASTR
uniref:helix-turn-helix domain-containing protein n=1 Tax=Petrimonas mucosa TaxID=1642646 RepID=UPI00137A5632|nr:helix-turn-helix domain-containing protein [Petrimonas mucosa]